MSASLDVTRTRAAGRPVGEILAGARALVDPALHAAVDAIADPLMRRIAAYQMGFCDVDGSAVDAGGKAVRPAITVLAAQLAGGPVRDAVPAAVAVELVHNFSLLHDDVMDRDVERRHRPTGWVAFGEGQAILAGNAMFTRAVEVLVDGGEPGRRALRCLLDATQRLIAGQSQDLFLEGRDDAALTDVLEMQAGKTAALLECAACMGALAVGAVPHVVAEIATFGHEVGIAFQLVDDILGVVGDPARTGKSASSDVRAGKRSAPIVAALRAPGPASDRLRALLADGPPATETDIGLATELITEAGGLQWAGREADRHMRLAIACLDRLDDADGSARADLIGLADYIVNRDR